MKKRCDYKPLNRQQQRQTVRRHGIVVIGLVVITLGSGVVMHLRHRAPPVPQVDQAVVAASIAPPPAPALQQPAPATNEVLSPKYNFYTELPKRQVAVP